jgi:uncharacterized protein YbbK (DUF523 family)
VENNLLTTRHAILVSACLLDIPCRYNGLLAENRLNPELIKRVYPHIVPICPEQLAGLPTPRKPVEIRGGDGFDVLRQQASVTSQDGEDFTAQFIKGAEITLLIAKTIGATQMITQLRSPSCSSQFIYDGAYCHKLIKGFGVTAALLLQHDIALIDATQC